MHWLKFLPASVGSGWTAGYIAVDRYLRPKSLEDTTEICLSHDCQNAEEFEAAVDELIAELKQLKVIARRKFKTIQG